MVDGLGTDLVEVGRIKRVLHRWGPRFLDRVFTPAEREYCLKKAFPEQSLAARLAAKEAVLKAIGTGLSGGLSWKDIEIVNDPKGKPEVRVGPQIAELIGNKRFILSISHTRELAVADVMLVKD